MPPTRSQKSRSTGAMLDRRFRPACKEKIEKFIETELAKQMRRLASVHKYLRIRDLCKEMAFGSQHAGGECRSSYNSFEFNVLCRQFLERRIGNRNAVVTAPIFPNAAAKPAPLPRIAVGKTSPAR